ncbi:MAG: GNAT family N-acetyltransferase [Alphaproteobacteria bacterium]|nr:GNAT family N-acetyltransferase [Alphaproteobacteria bacterium]
MNGQSPPFRRPRRLEGPRLRLREAGAADAAFILRLRRDPRYGRHLSATDDDLARQIAYVEACQADPGQIYFLIERLDGRAVGTVRLYDRRGDSFCWGSWILSDQKPAYAAIETTLLVYHYALACGFKAAHGEMRRANAAVWRFHEHYGGVRTGEDEETVSYAIDRAAIERALARYRRFAPSLRIEF